MLWSIWKDECQQGIDRPWLKRMVKWCHNYRQENDKHYDMYIGKPSKWDK